MQLLLMSALCALLATHVTCRQPLPADDLGLDQTNLADDAAVTSLFTRWQQKHGKGGLAKDATKYSKALENFRAAAARVKKNRDSVHAGSTDTVLGLNKFSHLSLAEFKGVMLGRKPRTRKPTTFAQVPSLPRIKRQTSAVNWTALGYVTSVKDQGQCGCCWTFSTVGALEAAYYKAKKTLMSFSEEELVDCVTKWQGCGGGVEDDAFNYVQQNKGISPLSLYPYIAGNVSDTTYTCKPNPANRVTMTVTWSYLNPGDTSVLNALHSVGPIALSIALNDPFQDYVSGVMDPSVYCLPAGSDNNHAVLLVGYGTDAASGKNYWLVKNSWSTDWGENGYFRMAATTQNACGLTAEPYMVTVS
jgi:cathepsin L